MKREDDAELFDAMRDNNIDRVKKLFEKGYNPSGLVVDAADDAPPLWRSIHHSLNRAISWQRIEIAELIIKRLKEIHANDPLELADQLMNGYAYPGKTIRFFSNSQDKEEISKGNALIDREIKNILPKLPTHVRSVVESRMQESIQKRHQIGM